MNRTATRRSAPSTGTARVELLEQRVLLAAYVVDDPYERFGVPDLIHEIAAPDDIEVAGYGETLARLGDVNGDGTPDFAIGAPGAHATADTPRIAGHVFVHSGETGELLYSLTDGAVGFGSALVGLNDVDGDGRADLVVGSWQVDANFDAVVEVHGRVTVYSGANGSIIRAFDGDTGTSALGYALANVGDVNADDIDDFAVGAPGAGASEEGEVLIISGADGAQLQLFSGEAEGDRFGHALAAHDGDWIGSNDAVLAIGVPGHDAGGSDAGRVYLTNAVMGNIEFTVDGLQAGEALGSCILLFRRGDESRLYAGAPGFDSETPLAETATDAGIVRVFDNTGAEIEDERSTGFVENGRRGERLHLLADPDLRGTYAVAITGEANESDNFPVLVNLGVNPTPGLGTSEVLNGTTRGISLGDLNGDDIDEMLIANTETGVIQVRSSLRMTDDRFAPPGDFGPGFAEPSPDLSVVIAERYLYLDGVFHWLTDFTALQTGDDIRAAGDGGDLVVAGADDQLYLVNLHDDTRTLVADLIVTNEVDTPPAMNSTLGVVGVTADGSIVFNQQGPPFRALLLHEGVLTELWRGSASDVNSRGDIVGEQDAFGDQIPGFVVRLADSNEVQRLDDFVDEADVLVEPLETVFPLTFPAGLRIGPTGIVAGMLADGRLATWDAGTITAYDTNPLIIRENPNWIILGIAADGTVIARLTQGSHRSVFSTDYILNPDGDVQTFASALFGEPRPSLQQGAFDPGPAWVAADGTILIPQRVFRKIAESEAWTAPPDSILGPVAGGGIGVGAETQLGGLIAFNLTEDGWVPVNVDIDFAGFGETFNAAESIFPYTDPTDGRQYILALVNDRVYWGQVADDGRSATLRPFNFPEEHQIVDNAALFVSGDGRVHLAGASADGDLIIYFQTGAFDPSSFSNWNFDNLTETHIESQGTTFTPIAGDLTAFVPAWGTNHIAYLDAAGQLHSVWWAPGMTFWVATNLSAAAPGAEPLHGTLTPYLTSWNGLNIAATNPDGRLAAIWWVPQFQGQWAYSLLGAADAPLLDPDSLTSYSLPWDGLTVAGIDAATGETTVYWWTPATNEWRAEPIAAADAPDDLVLTSGLAGQATPDGSQNLFAVTEDGELVRLHWSLADPVWRFESLLAEVTA